MRSFRGAAEKLNTTQPAVSMRIAQLEDLLGVRLLERDRRIVAPTPKGQELIGYAERLMRLRAEMIEAVGDRSTMRGIVRLGCSETIVHTWLPALIERVNAAYPNLELEIEVDITPNLRERLVARDLDLALLLGPISDPNIHSRPLCSFPLAFVAGSKIKLPAKADRARHNREISDRHILAQHAPLYRGARDVRARRPAGDDPRQRLARHRGAHGARRHRHRGHSARDPRQVAAVGKLRPVKTSAKLPSLNFVVSWPASPDSFAAQQGRRDRRAGRARRGVIRFD